jgi:hypothetical protein
MKEHFVIYVCHMSSQFAVKCRRANEPLLTVTFLSALSEPLKETERYQELFLVSQIHTSNKKSIFIFLPPKCFLFCQQPHYVVALTFQRSLPAVPESSKFTARFMRSSFQYFLWNLFSIKQFLNSINLQLSSSLLLRGLSPNSSRNQTFPSKKGRSSLSQTNTYI